MTVEGAHRHATPSLVDVGGASGRRPVLASNSEMVVFVTHCFLKHCACPSGRAGRPGSEIRAQTPCDWFKSSSGWMGKAFKHLLRLMAFKAKGEDRGESFTQLNNLCAEQKRMWVVFEAIQSCGVKLNQLIAFNAPGSPVHC
ncbi:unnamed protein product [Pylaiella littoralis]